MDIIVHMWYQPPSYVSKASVRDLPFIGNVAALCGSLFLERASKDSRDTTLEKIIERQKEVLEGKYPPLIIHPEGGVTNG
jgi:1-acyl-sn-glycerol-3-phosphate acyltransferase